MSTVVLGMKDARLRIRGDKNHRLGLCLSCSKPVTAREINSCGAKECNAACTPVFRWTRGVINRLNRVVPGAYVNYQMGQGGK